MQCANLGPRAPLNERPGSARKTSGQPQLDRMTAPGASAQRGQPATRRIRPARKSCSQLGTSPGPADSTVPGPSRCCRTEAPRLPYVNVPSSTCRDPRRDDHLRDVVRADCPHDHDMCFVYLRHIRIPFDRIRSSSGARWRARTVVSSPGRGRPGRACCPARRAGFIGPTDRPQRRAVSKSDSRPRTCIPTSSGQADCSDRNFSLFLKVRFRPPCGYDPDGTCVILCSICWQVKECRGSRAHGVVLPVEDGRGRGPPAGPALRM